MNESELIPRHWDYAETIAHRLCIEVKPIELYLRRLDPDPLTAFCKAVNKGQDRMLEELLGIA